MNETETNSPARTDLMDQITALQHQVLTLLLALVVVSGTLVSFLVYQSHTLGKDINTIKPQATQLIEAFKHEQPLMEGFVKQLAQYGATHPDFQPILKKYGIPLPSASAPAAAPAAPKK